MPARPRWYAAAMPVRPAPKIATGMLERVARNVDTVRRLLARWILAEKQLNGSFSGRAHPAEVQMPIPRRKSVHITGKILYVVEHPELLKQQLAGEELRFHPEEHTLIDNISTDEITPGWVCYYYDE